jgi:hypothetical protein
LGIKGLCPQFGLGEFNHPVIRLIVRICFLNDIWVILDLVLEVSDVVGNASESEFGFILLAAQEDAENVLWNITNGG